MNLATEIEALMTVFYTTVDGPRGTVEFTQDQIVEAGQALQSAGRNITGFALRRKIGGGKPSRLKQVWDEYMDSQAVTQAEPVMSGKSSRKGGI